AQIDAPRPAQDQDSAAFQAGSLCTLLAAGALLATGAAVVLIVADVRVAATAVLDHAAGSEAHTLAVLADRVRWTDIARGATIEGAGLKVHTGAVHHLIAERAIRRGITEPDVAHLTRQASLAADPALAE